MSQHHRTLPLLWMQCHLSFVCRSCHLGAAFVEKTCRITNFFVKWLLNCTKNTKKIYTLQVQHNKRRKWQHLQSFKLLNWHTKLKSTTQCRWLLQFTMIPKSHPMHISSTPIYKQDACDITVTAIVGPHERGLYSACVTTV